MGVFDNIPQWAQQLATPKDTPLTNEAQAIIKAKAEYAELERQAQEQFMGEPVPEPIRKRKQGRPKKI